MATRRRPWPRLASATARAVVSYPDTNVRRSERSSRNGDGHPGEVKLLHRQSAAASRSVARIARPRRRSDLRPASFVAPHRRFQQRGTEAELDLIRDLVRRPPAAPAKRLALAPLHRPGANPDATPISANSVRSGATAEVDQTRRILGEDPADDLPETDVTRLRSPIVRRRLADPGDPPVVRPTPGAAGPAPPIEAEARTTTATAS